MRDRGCRSGARFNNNNRRIGCNGRLNVIETSISRADGLASLNRNCLDWEPRELGGAEFGEWSLVPGPWWQPISVTSNHPSLT